MTITTPAQPTDAYHKDIGEVLLTPEAINARVVEVAKAIAADYAEKRPLVVGTLKGAVVFFADLVRAIHPVPDGLSLDFVRASSYGAGTDSSGTVSLVGSADGSLEGRHVLLVEDIVDTGHTAVRLLAHYRAAGAASVKLVSLLSKPARREVEIEPDYCCFDIPDKFVVGYGLDFAEHYRSLPYIGVLKPECYAK